MMFNAVMFKAVIFPAQKFASEKFKNRERNKSDAQTGQSHLAGEPLHSDRSALTGVARRAGSRASAKPSKVMVVAAAMLSVASASIQPAQAGGYGFYGPARVGFVYGPRPVGFYGPRFYRGGFYGPRFRRGFYGPRFRRRGIGPGEAALIAGGIIGGAILIDRAFDNRYGAPVYRGAPPQGFSDAYYRDAARRLDDELDRLDRRLDRVEREIFSSADRQFLENERRLLSEERRRLEEERRRLEGRARAFGDREAAERLERDRVRRFDGSRFDDRGFESRQFEDRRFEDDRFEDDLPPIDGRSIRRAPINPAPDTGSRAPGGREDPFDREIDEQLLGGPEPAFIRSAFNACAQETRAAAAAGSVLIALPAAPDTADQADGAGVAMTARFTAQDGAGATIQRTMRCEVDAEGVRFLEII
ncbi:MAG: hypothetical protein AAF850_10655 [Pseudomonadota bacterium]